MKTPSRQRLPNILLLFRKAQQTTDAPKSAASSPISLKYNARSFRIGPWRQQRTVSTARKKKKHCVAQIITARWAIVRLRQSVCFAVAPARVVTGNRQRVIVDFMIRKSESDLSVNRTRLSSARRSDQAPHPQPRFELKACTYCFVGVVQLTGIRDLTVARVPLGVRTGAEQVKIARCFQAREIAVFPAKSHHRGQQVAKMPRSDIFPRPYANQLAQPFDVRR